MSFHVTPQPRLIKLAKIWALWLRSVVSPKEWKNKLHTIETLCANFNCITLKNNYSRCYLPFYRLSVVCWLTDWHWEHLPSCLSAAANYTFRGLLKWCTEPRGINEKPAALCDCGGRGQRASAVHRPPESETRENYCQSKLRLDVCFVGNLRLFFF